MEPDVASGEGVVQKLLRNLIGARMATESGDWDLSGVKIEFEGGKLSMKGLNLNQCGQIRDGVPQNILQLLMAKNVDILVFADRRGDLFDEYEVASLIFDAEDLSFLSEADLVVLVGGEIAEIPASREAGSVVGDVSEAVDGVISEPVSKNGPGLAELFDRYLQVKAGLEAKGIQLLMQRKVEEYLRAVLGQSSVGLYNDADNAVDEAAEFGSWDLSDAKIVVEEGRVVVSEISLNQYTFNNVRFDRALIAKGFDSVTYNVAYCTFSFDLEDVERRLAKD